jgi:hypothetical protein
VDSGGPNNVFGVFDSLTETGRSLGFTHDPIAGGSVGAQVVTLANRAVTAQSLDGVTTQSTTGVLDPGRVTVSLTPLVSSQNAFSHTLVPASGSAANPGPSGAMTAPQAGVVVVQASPGRTHEDGWLSVEW